MDLKSGDLVRIQYTGRLATDGSMFESTDEETARKGGIWSTASVYGPKLAVFGKGSMLPGIEEALLTLNVGQSGEFKIPFGKAFGPRFSDLVRVMPETEFLNGGVKPQPGLMVMVEGIPASVKSVSSGRVMLDFNHPFAGQDVQYSIQLLDMVREPAEKVRALSELFAIPVRIEADGGQTKAVISKNADKQKTAALLTALKAAAGPWAQVVIEK